MNEKRLVSRGEHTRLSHSLYVVSDDDISTPVDVLYAAPLGRRLLHPVWYIGTTHDDREITRRRNVDVTRPNLSATHVYDCR
jgi:hypothetical protein